MGFTTRGVFGRREAAGGSEKAVGCRCFVCIVMDKLDGGDLVEGLQRHLKAWKKKTG